MFARLIAFGVFAVILAAACDDDPSGQIDSASGPFTPLPTDVPASSEELAAITGVWQGTVTPQDGTEALVFCLELSSGEAGVVEAAAYVADNREGYLQGSYDAFGLLFLSDGANSLEGRIRAEDGTLSGVWSGASAGGELALQKVEGVSC
jgi:hypothetical protein